MLSFSLRSNLSIIIGLVYGGRLGVVTCNVISAYLDAFATAADARTREALSAAFNADIELEVRSAVSSILISPPPRLPIVEAMGELVHNSALVSLLDLSSSEIKSPVLDKGLRDIRLDASRLLPTPSVVFLPPVKLTLLYAVDL